MSDLRLSSLEGDDMSTASERYDILIGGASFAGLALARALAASLGSTFRIGVLDKIAPAERLGRPDARAYAVSAASRHVLEVIGVWQHAAVQAEPVRHIDITDSSLDAGVRPVSLAYDNELKDVGEPATHIVPSDALLAAIVTAGAADAGVTILAPAEPVALELEASDGAARVTLSDGRVLTASLVVAADGRRSFLRDAAGIKVVGWGYGQTGIVATIAHERPHESRAVQHFLPAGPFAILPLTGGHRSCITWSERTDEAARIMTLDDAGFLAEVERRFGGRLGTLRLDGPRGAWPLEMHLARRFVANRFALIGDAAHGVHPIAGQGLNLAMRDVAALAECIVEAVRVGLDPGDADSLARYERWRRTDATMSTFTFDGLNRLFSSDFALLRSVREAGLGLVDRMPAIKRLLVSEAAGLTGELPRLVRGERL